MSGQPNDVHAADAKVGRATRFPCDPIMAMAPDAVHGAFIGGLFGAKEDAYQRSGPLAIIEISGPLMQRGGWFWDGYEAIRGRFGAALSDPSIGAVALLINSPGGVCAGCFESATAMRLMKAESGKPVFAFADEMAYSGGYAIACIADEIYLPEPGGVGSVGVIGVVYDNVKMNEDLGLNVIVVRSGEQKADLHPDAPLSDAAVERYRKETLRLAGLFAGLVSEARSKSVPDVLALQGATFHGKAAVTAGLADGVKSRDQFLAYAEREAKKALPKAATTPVRKTMGKNAENAAASGEPAAEALLVASPNLSAIALAGGISHSADEGSIIARVSGLKSTESKLLSVTGKGTVDEALGAIQAGQLALTQLDAANKELGQLKSTAQAAEVETLIETGKRDGKITSDAVERVMRETGAESPARLRSLLSVMPASVKASVPTMEPTASVSLTAEELQVARQMGIAPEQLMKNKAEAAAAAKEGA